MKLKIIIMIAAMLGAAAVCHAFDPDKDASMPDSHRSGWDVAHQQAAKNDPSYCSECHKPYFCIDCHQRRDTITQRVHKRNFKFYHSVEARANPHRCDACHSISFCTDCHRNPR
jgi:hypothetical protein